MAQPEAIPIPRWRTGNGLDAPRSGRTTHMQAPLPEPPPGGLPVPNAAIALVHSADPCFPTWGGEVEPVGCCDIAPQDMNRRHFGPRGGGPRGLAARGFGGRGLGPLGQASTPPNPYGLRHPHSTEHREALLCLSV